LKGKREFHRGILRRGIAPHAGLAIFVACLICH
jgi:hypothetical protein